MKSVFGVGYVGQGGYKSRINKKLTPQYSCWNSMLKRCYDEKYKEVQSAYIDCTVAEEWHNFQAFAKWYDDNYYEIEGQTMNLDKDILSKGNTIYSEDTCIFVPQRINKLFTKSNKTRGGLPIGVSFKDRNGKYHAQCRNDGKNIHLGYYNTPEEAFKAYKSFKEALIKDIAREYKGIIPERLYNSLMVYKVDERD